MLIFISDWWADLSVQTFSRPDFLPLAEFFLLVRYFSNIKLLIIFKIVLKLIDGDFPRIDINFVFVELELFQFQSSNISASDSLRIDFIGCKFVILPELYSSGYQLSPELAWPRAESDRGFTAEFLLREAKELNIYIGPLAPLESPDHDNIMIIIIVFSLGCGFLEADGSHFFDTYLIVGPNGIVAKSAHLPLLLIGFVGVVSLFQIAYPSIQDSQVLGMCLRSICLRARSVLSCLRV